jgi:hypothetical protein
MSTVTLILAGVFTLACPLVRDEDVVAWLVEVSMAIEK